MINENSTLRQMARESLKGKWNIVVPTFLVYFIIVGVIEYLGEQAPILNVLTIIVSGPIVLGISIFSLNISRNKDAKIEQLFEGFRNFGTSILAYVLMVLFIILWTILLIIPGIIAAISYSMTFFIIAEDETIGAYDALKKSKEMMNGHKWKFFCLGFSFFGWFLLSIFTLGIGLLWLAPYVNVSYVKFYDDIKEVNASK
ncbi:MAG: DUF975 family protein [Formosa sp.]|nr:DUF975 family protein [Formosa sp.]